MMPLPPRQEKVILRMQSQHSKEVWWWFYAFQGLWIFVNGQGLWIQVVPKLVMIKEKVEQRHLDSGFSF